MPPGVVLYMANPNCPVCQKPMARFENPTRFLCTRTALHAALEREARQHHGARNTGNARGNPQSKETLDKGKKKKKDK